MGVDYQRLPSVSRIFRRSLQGILESLVRHPQDAAGRRLGNSLPSDSRGVSKLLHSGPPRYLGRIPDVRAGIVKLVVVTPQTSSGTSGNSITANRWARILQALNHQVSIVPKWKGEDCDALIALHAQYSHSSV